MLVSGACRLYKYTGDLYFLDHLNFLCPSFEFHITFMPFLTVCDKVLNVRMHSWLPILSCQPHHFSLSAVPSWPHFCHNTHCIPASWQYQQFLATSAIDLSVSSHTPSNRRIWTPHVKLNSHISCNFCSVWIFILGAVNKHFWLLLMFYHFFLPPPLFGFYVKNKILIYSPT